MFQQSPADRRFHRVALNARVNVILTTGMTILCECVDFSEDGIDLYLPDRTSSFSTLGLGAGTIVHLEIQGPENPPRLTAAIIKASNQRIGLRFIKQS